MKLLLGWPENQYVRPYIRPPHRKIQEGRAKTVAIRLFGNKCFYCDIPLTDDIRTFDHLFPKSKGGKEHGNLVPACKGCNMRKGNHLPLHGEVMRFKKVWDGETTE